MLHFCFSNVYLLKPLLQPPDCILPGVLNIVSHIYCSWFVCYILMTFLQLMSITSIMFPPLMNFICCMSPSLTSNFVDVQGKHKKSKRESLNLWSFVSCQSDSWLISPVSYIQGRFSRTAGTCPQWVMATGLGWCQLANKCSFYVASHWSGCK